MKNKQKIDVQRTNKNQTLLVTHVIKNKKNKKTSSYSLQMFAYI